jgi:anti-sigma B factor antagonist
MDPRRPSGVGDGTDSPANGLLVRVEIEPDGAHVVVEGELDLATAGYLIYWLTEYVHLGLIVDLSGVPFCDSQGIHALVQLRQLCAGAGRSFGVVGLTESVRRIIEMAGLTRYLALPAPGDERTGDVRAGDVSDR